IGTRHNAFAVQIHEASHNLLLPWRKWNDVFCNVLGGYWTLNDVQAYRAVHLVHHTDLHLSTDPDLELYAIPYGARHSGIAKLILQDLLWITALRRMLAYVRLAKTRAKSDNAAALHLVAKLGCQVLLLAVACAVFGWWQGPIFY